MRTKPLAQGWYRDPCGIHDDRYISQGEPARLVRDGGRESYDPPPDRPPPAGDLVPAGRAGGEPGDGSDLRRADQACNDPSFGRVAWDVFDQASHGGGVL